MQNHENHDFGEFSFSQKCFWESPGGIRGVRTRAGTAPGDLVRRPRRQEPSPGVAESEGISLSAFLVLDEAR